MAKPQKLNPDQVPEVGWRRKVLDRSSSTAQKGIQNFPSSILINYFCDVPGKSTRSERFAVSPDPKKNKIKMYVMLMTWVSVT